jgi:carboxymethylenebutenolidase
MPRMKHLTLAALIGFLAVAPLANAADDLPPIEAKAKERLNTSPRHGEWVEVAVPGSDKKMKAYVVYPERKDKAPVVVVIQEIFGMTDWIRSVADQLAADGFIAIAPDLLSGPGGEGTDKLPDRDAAMKAVRGLKPETVTPMLNAARDYAIKLPSANGKSACIGFCWGGGTSFRYATEQPELNAAVVYYGTSPESGYDKIRAAVAGFYGGSDNRVTSTVKPAEEKMKALGKSYTPHVFEGAGHGFLRQQDGPKDAPGANLKAAEQAWPETIKFLRENTK